VRFFEMLIATLLFISTAASANDLFPIGSENKGRAMESTVASERGSAVLYNPANLTLTPGRRTYFEGGFANVSYAYEHPSYDTVVINTKTPIFAAGYGGLLIGDWYFGGVFLPTKGGSMEIPGVPRDVSGTVVPVSVKTSDLGLKTALGLSRKFSRGFRLGVSLIHQYDKKTLSANVVGNPQEVIAYDVYSHVITPKLGWRGQWDHFAAGMIYAPEIKKDFDGAYVSATDPNNTDIPLKEYSPAVFATGATVTAGGASLGLEYQKAQWSKGREYYNNGQGTASEADLNDTSSYGVNLSYDTGRKLTFVGGYASDPTPWGDGRGVEGEASVTGVDFGTLNGMDRSCFAIGSRFVATPESRIDVSLFRAQGKRETDAEASVEGRFEMAITAATATFSQQF